MENVTFEWTNFEKKSKNKKQLNLAKNNVLIVKTIENNFKPKLEHNEPITHKEHVFIPGIVC